MAQILFAIAVSVLLTAVPATAQDAPARTPQWLFDHGHIGECRAVAARLLAANAKDASALAWYARTQTLAGDVKGAIATAERAVAADPKSMLAYLALAEALGEEAERASIFRQPGLARRVRQALETAVALAPNDPDALNGMMQYYLRAPGIVGGSAEKADQMAARIIAIDPGRGYVARAEIARHNKQAGAVEGWLLKAVEANPKSVHARAAIANFYASRPAKQAEAERHAKALLAIDPALVAPYRVLAIVYARGTRWTELDDILAKSDEQHPSNLVAWLAAAQVLRESGADNARAERYRRRYTERHTEITSSNKRPVA